jgi:hypothetical protein
MKKTLFIISLIMSLLSFNNINAQKGHLEIGLGLRDEEVKMQVLKGAVQHVSNAMPLLDISLRREFNQKWNGKLGFGVQMYTNHTTIETGFDFNRTINFQTLPLVSFGVERSVVKTKRLEFNLGINQQAVFILNNNPLNNNASPSGEPNNIFFKSETVTKFQSVNPITQFSSQLNYKLKNNKTYVFFSYSYNLGWLNMLNRNVKYTIDSKEGEANILTRGSGIQARFGLGLPIF